MNVSEAIKYIHSVSWLGSKPGLGRTRRLLKLMGNPQDKLKFVHVAGTNGKGSVCAMLASVLQSQGYRTGLYTSPYILRFNERMRINGEDIPDDKLAEVTGYVKSFADTMEDTPTEFELVTCIGFEYFYREKCDIVVLEVGLGGELDSTNVIKAPLVSVITEIDYDHVGVLGNSLEEIARAKAGIIKSGSVVVSADNTPSSAAVIAAACTSKGCARIVPDFNMQTDMCCDKSGVSFSYNGIKYHVPLLGKYQLRNALLAITAAKALDSAGFSVDGKAILVGLESVRWHGRFERLCTAPLLYYDGGHNPQGVKAAVETYRELHGDERCVALVGVMADKDYGTEIEALAQIAACFVTVTPDNPRALSAKRLAETVETHGGTAYAAESVSAGVALAGRIAKREVPILAVGSLYMYGEIFAAVKKLFTGD